jgi:hypothetical protein
MRILAAIAVGLMVVRAYAADEIPERFKKGAEKTFAEGKSYFIWTTNTHAVRGQSSPGFSAVSIDCKMIAGSSTNVPNFRAETEGTARDRKDGTLTQYGGTFPGKRGKAWNYEKPGHPFNTYCVALAELEGASRAKIWLVDGESGKTNAISNVLVVDVEFKGTN